jgi:uncharacterized repeat protein (TIGR01451 family)
MEATVGSTARRSLDVGRRSWRGRVSATTLAVTCVLLVAPSAHATSAPDLTVTKSSDAVGARTVGDRFSYTIAVTNVGSATAHLVSLEDDLPVGLIPRTVLPVLPGGTCTIAGSVGGGGPPRYSVHCDRPALEAGTSVSVSFEVVITDDVACGALTNIVRVEARDEPAVATGNDEASVTDTVTCPPSISIATTAPRFTHVGATVHLSMEVRNDGAVPLGHVRVAVPGCAGSPSLESAGGGDATLAPGEAWRYGCSRTIGPAVGRVLVSTAIVTARSPAGTVRAGGHLVMRVLDPGLSLRVTASPVSATPGDRIVYHYLVRNDGDTTLTGVSVDDDHLGHIGDIATLIPGHTARLSALRVVSARRIWVVNVASAAGTDPSGATVRASGHAVLTIVDAGTGWASPGTDATAFTGAGTAAPASAMVILALLGAAALLTAGRRHS